MRDPKERLRDILEAIAAIERYLPRGRGALEQDELLQVWFLRHLQIIGEAARALPEDVRALAPEAARPYRSEGVWGSYKTHPLQGWSPRRGEAYFRRTE